MVNLILAATYPQVYCLSEARATSSSRLLPSSSLKASFELHNSAGAISRLDTNEHAAPTETIYFSGISTPIGRRHLTR